MGINSTEVSYGFGQLGSVFTNLAKPVFPPKDHVIVAIQFLADNTPTQLITETLDTMGPQFITTEDTEANDANYIGVTEAAASGTGSTAGVLTIGAANSKIKKGQYVLIAADSDTIDTGLTIDHDAMQKASLVFATPVYQGPNQSGVVVKSISDTTLTLEHFNGQVFDASSIDANNTLYFLDEYHGAGGTTIEGVKFPKGLTIYGRWSMVQPEADDDGGIICYFGK
tara:strand:+ start:18 stop:695 length:678 start_codon:yes stop_codon:yes gene_type:complete